MIDLKQIEATIDYHFDNPDLLQQAFVRKSYSAENGGQNNEVLEFIGDKALDFAVIRIMMERFGKITEDKDYSEFKLRNPRHFQTKLGEGKFTDIKKQLVQKKALSRCIENLGFHEQLIVGKGDEKQNVSESTSVKEDLFEAIIGAVAIDSNYDMDTITQVVENMIDFDSFFNNEENELENYVGMLQEWSQKQGYGLPHYEYSEMTSDGTYECSCTIEGDDGFYHEESGEGYSKAEARMNAAHEYCMYLTDEGYITNEYEDAVGEPDRDESTRQVNELFQKKLISKPLYEFYEEHDEDGESEWTCVLTTDAKRRYQKTAYTKKEAQRECAYEYLCDLMDYEYEE